MELHDLIIQVTQNAAVGLVLFNKDHQAVFANSFFQKKTGFEPEELQGTGFFKRLFPDNDARVYLKNKISSCFTRPFENLRTQLQKKTKGTLSVSISGSPFTKDEQEFVSCVVQDLTNQNAYEKVIEAEYDNFQQLTIDLEAAMKKNREQQKILEAYKQAVEVTRNQMWYRFAGLRRQFDSMEQKATHGMAISGIRPGVPAMPFFNQIRNIMGRICRQ